MAIPIAIGLLLVLNRLEENVVLVQSMLIWDVSQLPLDIYLVITGSLTAHQAVLDITVLSISLIGISALYPASWDIKKSFLLKDTVVFKGKSVLRIILLVLFVYLLLGWLWATFLPRLMNSLLEYPVGTTDVLWVQYTGPLALVLGMIFLLSYKSPNRNHVSVYIVGIMGCIIELLLDLFLMYKDKFKLWQLSLDLPVVIVSLFVLCLFARQFYNPKRSDENSY